MNAMKLFTLGDFFRQRYGAVPEKIASVIMIFAFTILLAGNMVACGFLLERFAGIPYAFGVIVAVLLVLAYTVGGGLFSDAYTAAIQTTITIVATIAMLIWVALSFGIVIPEGMGPFDFEQLTSAEAGAPINWATLISLGIGDLVAIDFMQRIFGAKSPEVARRSCFIGAGLTFGIGVIYAIVALTVTAVLGLTTENGPILFQLLGRLRAAAAGDPGAVRHRRRVVLDRVRRDPGHLGHRGPQPVRSPPAGGHRGPGSRCCVGLDWP